MKPVHWQRATTITVSFWLAVVASGVAAPAVRAQFTSPPDQGTPQTTAGGGSRPINGSCPKPANSQQPLIALAPTGPVGLTPQARPSFWVYLPPTEAKTLEFSLFTQDQKGVYQTNLPINRPGLLKMTLPSQGVELKAGQLYRWKVALVCNPEDRTKDWVVSRLIQQQPLNAVLRGQLAAATPEQQIQLYTQSGFWYEAFNTYVKLRQAQPKNGNLTAIWAELAQSAGLGPIVLSTEGLRAAEPTPLTQANR